MVVLMVVMIAKWRVHPFFAILGISLVLAIAGGLPVIDGVNEAGEQVKGVASIIGDGFSATFSSIGIVIIFGAMIGAFLEVTGAALTLADTVVKLVGKKRPALAMEIMGWVVSIPVFCDSGFVVLNPIRHALVKKTKASSVQMTVCLAAGLYVSHVFIPPTPGPIAAANTLGFGNNLLLIMGFGALVSIPALIAAYFYAKFIGKKVHSKDEADNAKENIKTYEELKASFGKLPNIWISIAPILVPILLMALANISTFVGWEGALNLVCQFFGTPIFALAVGVILGIVLLIYSKKSKELYKLTEETLKVVGPILFVTAAGGVLGKVISAAGLINFVSENAWVLQSIGIFFPFLVAAVLKSAQGSSTVAITTTAGLMAPLLPVLGMTSPTMGVLVVMAIGAGAMTVSHANDSYFWVVTNFGGLRPEQGYRTQTVCTLIMGLTSIVFIWILTLVF